MTFADKRLRVIARRASMRCETKTVGHDKGSNGKEYWIVVPHSRQSVETQIFWAIKTALEMERKRTA